MFLESLFDTEEDSAGLECDTKQVGCELNCINRFTPLNHTRIWEAELFMVVFTNLSFTAFRVFNEYQYNKFRGDAEIGESEEKLIENEKMVKTGDFKKVLPRTIDESVYHFKQKSGNQKNFIKSRITNIGYLIMLFIRLFGEICFIYLENQLGKHQSQNIEFWNAFNLKENWICSSNNKDTAAVESLDQLIPVGNRSEIFWTDDLNVACLQHRVTVTCWIPFSRMKSYGMWFMFLTLCFSCWLTVLEICWEFCYHCCRFNGRKKGGVRQGNGRVLRA